MYTCTHIHTLAHTHMRTLRNELFNYASEHFRRLLNKAACLTSVYMHVYIEEMFSHDADEITAIRERTYILYRW